MKYVEGDLFNHVPTKGVITFIPHVCNNIGAWGAGFVIPLGKHYPAARDLYLETKERSLGDNQIVAIMDSNTGLVTVAVANMIAQDGIGPKFDGDKMIPPIRYDSLRKCMEGVRESCKVMFSHGFDVRIACPMFGAGLAGGDWPTIEGMIAEIWGEIDTTVYYLPQFLPAGWTPPHDD